MLKISRGERTKDEVIKTGVEKYREIFKKISKEAVKLDTVNIL